MIRVNVDLKSAISHTRDRALGGLVISNIGKNEDNHRLCDYKGEMLSMKSNRICKTVVVENYASEAYSIWRLVFRMLWELLPEERRRIKHALRKEIKEELKEKDEKISKVLSA